MCGSSARRSPSGMALVPALSSSCAAALSSTPTSTSAKLASLGEVASGRAFLLQAGDCAESFHDFTAISIRERLKVLLQMSAVLTYGAGVSVVKVGRIAGQFAKPRSSQTERVGDEELPSFFGHLVNDDAPLAEARVADPARMVRAYH